MTELFRSLASGQRPRPRALVAPLVVLVLLAAIGFAVHAAARTDPADGARTIVLVARDMTFYVDGRVESNPRLVAARGETVRFVLRHDDPGMGHDLSLPTLGVATGLLHRRHSSTELVVRMPERSGEHPYLCSLHALTMRGVVDVR